MKSLKKATDILDLFLELGDVEIRLSEIAKMTGLHVATTNRLVSAWVKLGYMQQSEKRGKYTLGKKFIEFADILEMKTKLKTAGMPYLSKLFTQVEETVAILSWDGKKLIFIEEIRAKHLFPSTNASRILFQLYCTAIGKICLAEKSDEELKQYFETTQFVKHLPNTITDYKKMKTQLKQVKKEGVAYEIEEHFAGIGEVGCAVRNHEGKLIGCVGVLGPTSRLTPEKMRNIAPYLKQCSLDISAQFGYMPE